MRFTAIMFVLMFTLAAPVAADNLISEPHALVYFQLPFSGDAPDTRSHFGLRMDRTQRASGQALDYREVMLRPAMVDLRFNESGMESFKFGGVDYLAQYRTMKADEEQATGAAGATAEPAATEAAGEQGKTEEKPKAEEKPKSEEDKLTMDKVMHKIPIGYFIGAGIGVLMLATSALD